MNHTLSWSSAGLKSKARAITTGRAGSSRSVYLVDREINQTMPPIETEEYEGFTEAQFMVALKAVSEPMARRALRAKEEGMLSAEESRKFLDDILHAGD